MENINIDSVVERIFSLWDEGANDEEIIINTINNEFNMEGIDTESFLELTRSGFLRANFLAKGTLFPKSNLNDHPIVLSALKIGLIKLGHPELYEKYENIVKPKKPWWKFW